MTRRHFVTPPLLPGCWYVTYTSDDTMRPVFITPFCVEKDRNGLTEARFKDSALGDVDMKDGDKRLAFYARVKLPVDDMDNPVLLEKGEFFEQIEADRKLQEQEKELRAKRAALRIARATAGGTR